MPMSPERVLEHATKWRKAFRTMVIVVFTMLVAFGVVIAMLIKANFWFAEPGVLKELRLQNPNVISIVKIERNFLAYSVVTACMSDGREAKFLLDTDLFFRYELKEKP